MTPRADWFTHANPAEVAQEYLLGPQDLDEIKPGVWGHKGFGAACLGDQAHMRKISGKLFNDRFHATPCPLGNYKKGEPPLPSVFERLSAMGVIPKGKGHE